MSELDMVLYTITTKKINSMVLGILTLVPTKIKDLRVSRLCALLVTPHNMNPNRKNFKLFISFVFNKCKDIELYYYFKFFYFLAPKNP